MSAPTTVPRSPRCSVEEFVRTTVNLVVDFGFSIRCRPLGEDVGIMDLDHLVIELDSDSTLADHVTFIRECWAFCAIDPEATAAIETVHEKRHLVAVPDESG